MIASRTEIRGADIAQHYDALDVIYREIWGERVHHGWWRTGRETFTEARDQLETLIINEAAPVAGQRICDIGCGYGAMARILAVKRGAEVTGITISPAQHAIAVRQSAEGANPRFILGDWLANDLSSSSFDAAIAFESSEHMSEKSAFFAQAHRILRPGGRLVIAGWLIADHPKPWQQRWLLEPICREARMPQLGTEGDYRRLAEEAGFIVDRFQDLSPGIAHTWPTMVRIAMQHLLRHPLTVRHFLPPAARHHLFALTIARLWIAFRAAALRYGLFTLTKRGA